MNAYLYVLYYQAYMDSLLEIMHYDNKPFKALHGHFVSDTIRMPKTTEYLQRHKCMYERK